MEELIDLHRPGTTISSTKGSKIKLRGSWAKRRSSCTDDESNVLLESSADVVTAIDYAKATGASPSLPSCVRLAVAVIQEMESRTSEQKIHEDEDEDEYIPQDPKPLLECVYSAAEMRNIRAVQQLQQAASDAATTINEAAAVAKGPTDTKPYFKAPVPVMRHEFLLKKPPMSYANMAALALKNSPTGELPVKDIFNFMIERWPYYKNAPASWKNSVRHTLATNEKFMKREINQGKMQGGNPSVWLIVPEMMEKVDLDRALASTRTDCEEDYENNENKPLLDISFSADVMNNILANLQQQQYKSAAAAAKPTTLSTPVPQPLQQQSYSSTEMHSIRAAVKLQQAKASVADSSTTAAISSDVSKGTKLTQELSYSSTEMRSIRKEMGDSNGVRRADLKALKKFNAEVENDETLQLVVISFRVDQNISTDETTMVLRCNSAADFSLWEQGLMASLRAVDALDCLTTSSRKCELTITVAPVELDWLLFWLKSLASKTDFNHVQIDGASKTIRNFSEFLCNSRVCQLTVQQKSDDVDQFTPLIEFMRNVRPRKIRVSRREVTKELLRFLMEAAEVVESIWIGGVHAQGTFPLHVTLNILSGNCSYLHISDRVTKASPVDVIMLLRHFLHRLDKKVSLAVPSDVLRSGIGKYSIRRPTGGKFAYEKDILLIEHVDMEPKAEDMC